MATELTPSSRSLSLDLEAAGRPDDLFSTSTDQKYWYGKRILTFDGKVYKYNHSLGTIYPGYGAFNGAGADVSTLINSVTPAAIAIDDKQTTITIADTEGYAAGGVVAEDELVGAYLVLGHGAATTTENRTVVANTAAAAGGGTITVWVDMPFKVAHDAGVACELPLNPYRYCIAASEVASVMSVANMSVTTGYNFWGQTWGPCWCVPGGADTSIGNSVNDRSAYFVGDGSVNGGTYLAASESGKAYQLAGFIIDTTESGTGCMPLLMLQISI